MAYAYVKSGGTATGTAGKYETAKTGSWSTAFTDPSQYYGNILACYNVANLTTGDFIIVSNLHAYSVTTSATITINFSILDLKLISVDDSDISIPLPGASETFLYTGSTSYYLYFSIQYVYGLKLEVSSARGLNISNISLSGYPYSIYRYENCTFIAPGTSYSRYLSVSYPSIFTNCTFSYSGTRTVSIGSSSVFKNCTFIYPTNNSNPIQADRAEFEGCDFSQYTSTTLVGISYSNSMVNVSRSLEHANNRTLVPNGNLLGRTGYYYDTGIYSALRLGKYSKLETDTNVYRLYERGATFDLTTYYSYKVTTTSSPTIYNPARFKLCDFYFNASGYRTINVFIAQDNAAAPLLNNEIFLEISYIKDYDSPKSHTLTTADPSNLIFNTGIVPIEANSNMWNSLVTPTKQKLNITIPGNGGYGIASVSISVTKPNLTFYVCPKVDIT